MPVRRAPAAAFSRRRLEDGETLSAVPCALQFGPGKTRRNYEFSGFDIFSPPAFVSASSRETDPFATLSAKSCEWRNTERATVIRETETVAFSVTVFISPFFPLPPFSGSGKSIAVSMACEFRLGRTVLLLQLLHLCQSLIERDGTF